MTSLTVSDGLSAMTVSTPTMTASTEARMLCSILLCVCVMIG